jgi:hypothetical protein
MNYWMTVHYPMSEEDKLAGWRYWLFLKTRRPDLRPGDRVFIYETGTNPSYMEGRRSVARPPGRKAVIALVRVTTEVRSLHDADEILEDGRVHHWRFGAETELERQCDIPLTEVRQALRMSNWCAVVRGGLMWLSEAQFNRILSRCS